ncbi:MAG: DedA family protein [Nanoarchaeota archaeon]|nr:DedA family protein [Nanoarchaeota archaeon]
MIEFLVEYITLFIDKIGYIGIFVLMVLESMIAPIPSEAVMPFAGYLVTQGRFDFWTAAIISGLASVVGSLIGYYMGYVGGYPIVRKVGKYLFLDEGHLKWTERFFKKYGSITIFTARFIPVVRHLISIPAGIARMDLKRFVFYTAIGATIWNTFLLYVGFRLAEHWHLITEYSRPLDMIVLAVIAIYLMIHVRKWLRASRS